MRRGAAIVVLVGLATLFQACSGKKDHSPQAAAGGTDPPISGGGSGGKDGGASDAGLSDVALGDASEPVLVTGDVNVITDDLFSESIALDDTATVSAEGRRRRPSQ